MDFNLFPKFIDEAMSPVAKTVGNTMSNLWQLGIGSHVNFWAEKQAIKQSQALEAYRTQIISKIAAIPEDKMVEPQLHIVGPALEASKFYVQDEDLRNMFANLIAASINKDTVKQTHPSFVETIKQLSPLDAQNLKLLSPDMTYPIVNYVFILKNKGGYIMQRANVFLENTKVDDIDLNSASITNLDRLGLVNIDFQQHKTDKSLYEKFKKTDYFNSFDQVIKVQNNDINHPLFHYEKIDIQTGLFAITPYGKNFIRICVQDK